MNTYSKLKLTDLLYILEAFADGPQQMQYNGKATMRARKKEFYTLWMMGLNHNVIALRLGIKPRSVDRLRIKFGFPPRKAAPKPVDYARAA